MYRYVSSVNCVNSKHVRIWCIDILPVVQHVYQQCVVLKMPLNKVLYHRVDMKTVSLANSLEQEIPRCQYRDTKCFIPTTNYFVIFLIFLIFFFLLKLIFFCDLDWRFVFFFNFMLRSCQYSIALIRLFYLKYVFSNKQLFEHRN